MAEMFKWALIGVFITLFIVPFIMYAIGFVFIGEDVINSEVSSINKYDSLKEIWSDAIVIENILKENEKLPKEYSPKYRTRGLLNQEKIQFTPNEKQKKINEYNAVIDRYNKEMADKGYPFITQESLPSTRKEILPKELSHWKN